MKQPRFSIVSLCCSVLLLTGVLAHAENHLTVYIYPAPLGIDWRSPNALGWSTIGNSLLTDKKLHAIHSIGHMNFHLKCDPSNGLTEGADIETGQTNTDDDEMKSRLLSEGYGLGVMTSDYTGAWEKADDIEEDLLVRYQRGSVAFMDISISTPSCARIVEYLKDYHQRGYDQIYGGLQRKAREGDGAGCAAFTESVLEIAGVMRPEWQSYWSHTVNAPLSLIGGPQTGNHVSVWDVLFTPKSWKWNKTVKDSMVVNFWDPFYAYWWVQYAHQGKASLKGYPLLLQKRGKAKGIAVDATQIPTPTEDFWQP